MLIKIIICVLFIGFKTLTDLVILDMEEFDVILGMSWLSLIMLFLIVAPNPSL